MNAHRQKYGTAAAPFAEFLRALALPVDAAALEKARAKERAKERQRQRVRPRTDANRAGELKYRLHKSAARLERRRQAEQLSPAAELDRLIHEQRADLRAELRGLPEPSLYCKAPLHSEAPVPAELEDKIAAAPLADDDKAALLELLRGNVQLRPGQWRPQPAADLWSDAGAVKFIVVQFLIDNGRALLERQRPAVATVEGVTVDGQRQDRRRGRPGVAEKAWRQGGRFAG